MDERIVAKGKIFELVQLPQKDGRVFEVARRAPGTRIIIADLHRREVLLTKEYRHELGTHDYRLPGGKVFDTLEEYDEHRKDDGDILAAATAKVIEEARQEAGIDVVSPTLVKKSSLGATVEWDLYIFAATEWRKNADGQDLQEDEQEGIEVKMYSFAQVEKMILDGNMQEDRVALVLLRWLKQQLT